jgi:hypothetical protein
VVPLRRQDNEVGGAYRFHVENLLDNISVPYSPIPHPSLVVWRVHRGHISCRPYVYKREGDCIAAKNTRKPCGSFDRCLRARYCINRNKNALQRHSAIG